MKEATGDMTMTVVVIVSVVAILAIGKMIWPKIQQKIEGSVNNISYVELVDNYRA